MTDYGEKDTRPSPYAPLKPDGTRAIAVAIQANEKNPNGTAKVVAAGRGELAEQILMLALKKGVKVREDADLAEILAKLELDTPIPSEAIIAVAEILAKVYEANAQLGIASPPPAPPKEET